jgi:hypothetical protein
MKKILNVYLLAVMMMSLLFVAVVVHPVSAADLGFGAPSIQITSPNDKATIPAGNVTVNVHVDDLTMENKLGAANVEGQGHIHYFMDVPVPTTPGKPALTAAGTYYPTANTSYTWTNVMLGMHNFTVELVNNDHTPLNPAKYAMINVTVNTTASATATTKATASASGY